MLDYIKENKGGLSVILIGVLIGIFLCMSQGCNMYDIFKMHVPTDVQRITGAPAQIPLSEYERIREKHMDNFYQTMDILDANYSDAAFFADLASMGIEMGIDTLGTSAATVPGGAILLSLLTGAGGLMINKPGSKKEQEAVKQKVRDEVKAEAEKLLHEKIASYNKGKKDATPIL